MTSTATVAHQLKVAAHAAVAALYADDDEVLVTFGHPGLQTANFKDSIVFEGWSTEQDPAVVSTQRSRNERIRLNVVITSQRPGGNEAEVEAEAAAAAMLAAVEYQFRVTDTTATGVTLYAFLTESTCEGTPVEDLESGRSVVITATISALARITGTT